MRSEERQGAEPTARAPNARLSARAFYGVIVAGLVLGVAVCGAAGWAYLEYGDRRPTGRRIWDAMAAEFVIPVCVIVGATFGGVMGFVAAVFWDSRRSSGRQVIKSEAPGARFSSRLDDLTT
jgi:hypothetical protein